MSPKRKKHPASRTGARRESPTAPPTNAWPKGMSGNPEGRPKTDPELVEAFRARTPRALATLDKVLSDFEADKQTEKGDPLIPATAAVKAAEVVLNRGWGTAPTTIKLDVKADVTSKARVEVATPLRLMRVAQVLVKAGALPQVLDAPAPVVAPVAEDAPKGDGEA